MSAVPPVFTKSQAREKILAYGELRGARWQPLSADVIDDILSALLTQARVLLTDTIVLMDKHGGVPTNLAAEHRRRIMAVLGDTE